MHMTTNDFLGIGTESPTSRLVVASDNEATYLHQLTIQQLLALLVSVFRLVQLTPFQQSKLLELERQDTCCLIHMLAESVLLPY